MILAGIDIGTNTLRLLIANVEDTLFQIVHSDRKITRLGQDLERSGSLSQEAEERSIAALREFASQFPRFSVVETSAVGTSALRNASNAGAFINRAERETGIRISIITGDEEARLTLKGIGPSLKGRPSSPVVVFDIGGGSTEIILNQPGSRPVIMSLPLGAVYLTERFIEHDPPLQTEVADLRAAVKHELRMIGRAVAGFDDKLTCAGTGGTITTLAAIDQQLEYDPERVNNAVLTRESIDSIILKLSTSSRQDARKIAGLEPGREDIILAGAIIAQELLKVSGCPNMVVSDWGLREGIILDLYEKRTKA